MNITALIGLVAFAISQHGCAQLELSLKVVTVIVVHLNVLLTTDRCQDIFTWQRVIPSKLWIVAVNLEPTCVFLHLVLVAGSATTTITITTTTATTVAATVAAIVHLILFDSGRFSIRRVVIIPRTLVMTLVNQCTFICLGKAKRLICVASFHLLFIFGANKNALVFMRMTCVMALDGISRHTHLLRLNRLSHVLPPGHMYLSTPTTMRTTSGVEKVQTKLQWCTISAINFFGM